MKKAILISFIAVVLCFTGCSLIEKIAPSQLDAAGSPIPGTHDVSHPYGEAAIGVLLLVWNGYEKIRANKFGKGLTSTVQAIEKAGEDPALAELVAKLKEELSHAHDVAGVQPIIKAVLSKL